MLCADTIIVRHHHCCLNVIAAIAFAVIELLPLLALLPLLTCPLRYTYARVASDATYNWGLFEGAVKDPYIPHPDWLLNSTNWAYYVGLSLLTLVLFYGSFVSSPSYESIRWGWTLISVGLYAKKTYDFYRFDRLLYYIDYCYFANVCFGFAMWSVPSRGGKEGKKWLQGLVAEHTFPFYARAVFTSVNGPVGGGCFMLGTALAVHNIDVYFSFWLHVVPMWITYALRWRLYPKLLEVKYPEMSKALEGWKKRETVFVAIK